MSPKFITLLMAGCTSQGIEDRRQKAEDRVAYSRDCQSTLTCPTEDNLAECRAEYLPTDDQRHVEGEVDYPVYPPVGGAHYRCWWDWGVFAEEIPEERWVHNLEHGGVVFLYNCPDGCSDEVSQIVSAFEGRERLIVSPYSHMEWRFAAVSWEYRTLMDCLDIDKLDSFYKKRMGHGPEDVASMAPSGCMEDDAENEGSSGPDTGDRASDTGS